MLILGYNQPRQFEDEVIVHARITSEQVALALSKSSSLDEERKQVRHLTALHDVALTSTLVDHEDELIERITDIIGRNLFTDNFGVLLLDEQKEMLRTHPSYRFFSDDEILSWDVQLGKGITGRVAMARQPERISNVRRVRHYLNVDERTVSEICVPILFKEQLLGVINPESTKRNAFITEDERLLVTLAGQLATAIEQIRKSDAKRKWLDQLAHSNDLIYSLAQITTHIDRALTLEEFIPALGRELNSIDVTCIMATYDEERDRFTIN